MKLLKIAAKELKLIKTQKISMLLILFFPIITILAIGVAFGNVNIFTGTGFSEMDVAVYIPNNNDNNSTIFGGEIEGLLTELDSYKAIRLVRYSSEEQVKQSIEKRKTKIGIIIKEPKNSYSGIDTIILFDNSSLLETQVTLFVTQTILSEVSHKKATETLKGILSNLESIKSTVKEEIKTIDSFIDKLNSSYFTLNNLENQLNQIDLTSMQNQLNEFDSYYIQAKNDISDTRNEIYSAQSKLSGYRTKIQNTRNNLVYYRDELTSLRNQITSIRNSSPEEIASQLIPIENQLTDVINELNTSINELDQALIDLDETNNKLNQTLNKLNEVDIQLNSANSSIQSFKYTVNSMQNTLNQIKLMLTEAKKSRESVLNDLTETKQQMQLLSSKLDNLSSLSPETVVRPLTITKEPLYESTEVSVLTPIAIAIVLLLTCLLLTSISVILEKNQGAELRAKLSPTLRITWISGKILGQMIFALIEAIIILVVAFVGFGVVPLGNLIELFFVLILISFSFISMGIFLTNFTKTQSTAILSSLLIIVPLIFLSGMILPTSFMPPFIKVISEILPLTIATELITAILVRGTPLFFLLPQVLLLVVPAVLMIVFSLIYPKMKEK